MDLFENLTDLESQCLLGIKNELVVSHEKAMGGDPEAQFTLAMLYLDYCPTTRFEEEAIRLLTLSADQGHEEAKNQLLLIDSRQYDPVETPVEDIDDDVSDNDSISNSSLNAFQKTNDKNKEIVISNLPSKAHDLLVNNVFSGKIPINKILYAGKISKNVESQMLV